METLTRESEPDRQQDFERVQKARYRPARLTGLLLVLQAAGLGGLVAYELLDLSILARQGEISAEVQRRASDVASIFFVPPAVLALLAALSLMIVARRGWLLAASSQSLCLAVCLWLYSIENTPFYVYPVMTSSILIILYLNSRTVRTLFHSRQTTGGKGRRG